MSTIENMVLGAANQASVATQATGDFINPDMFEGYAEVVEATTAVTVTVPAVATPAPINNTGALLAIGKKLLADYRELKRTVFDRSDRALWELLSNLFDYVLTIEDSAEPARAKKALRDEIDVREGENISTAVKTEVLVVRYLFADAARQTRNNYSNVMRKAKALGKTYGDLYAFLEEFNGVANVLEHDFSSGEGSETSSKDALKAERTEKATLMRSLFTALSHTGTGTELTSSEVQDYNLGIEAEAALKDSEKSKLKNQRGDFVFFVAVPSAGVDQYTVVHSFKTARDFEELALLEIAKGMKADLPTLRTTVKSCQTAAFQATTGQ